MTIVAFQGENGAYSQEAACQFFGAEVDTLPCRTFEDIFLAVKEGRANHGILPVENSAAGSINKAYDLLLDHDLRVWGEVIFRVRHALLATADTTPEDIERYERTANEELGSECARWLAFGTADA